MKKATEILIQGQPTILDGTEIADLRITSAQKLINRDRFVGVSFWEIPEQKIIYATDEIIFTMCAVFGLPIPENNLQAEYLAKSILTVINDFGYSELTVAEIVLAINLNTFERLKNNGGDDLQKVPPPKMPCGAFLASILANYKILRDNLDRMIERRILGY